MQRDFSHSRHLPENVRKRLQQGRKLLKKEIERNDTDAPVKTFDKYRNLMNCVDVSPEVKHQIIENCAKYSTIKKSGHADTVSQPLSKQKPMTALQSEHSTEYEHKTVPF